VAVIVAWGGVGKTSLVFAWMNRLAADGYRGATAVFDWSFYSQGVRERGAASGDQFVREALRFFGDEAMADGAASAWDKGARLAELVGRQRALLVLDGLEPLQQPPGRAAAAGKLTDPAIAALLRGLARTNAGLCVVTTRETVEDLEGLGTRVSQRKLERLSEDAGVELLRSLLGQARVGKPEVGSTTPELAAMWKAVDGHALTLSLLGRYLHRRRWDVRRWREVRFEAADGKVQGGHAFRMLGAYERWLAGEDGEATPGGQRMLAVLRILGLFDRAADPGCIGAICEGEAIEGLTEPLVGLDEGDWTEVLADLEALGLVSRETWEPLRIEGFGKAQADLRTGKATGAPEVTVMPGWSRLSESLDAHPLVREHFGQRVKAASEAAWKEGHRRVFEHLCGSTPYWPEGTQGLQPLYQAVAHGCQAGEVENACIEVYQYRIQRGTSPGGYYPTNKLGAVVMDLAVLAWFFDRPWSDPMQSLHEDRQAWIAHQAFFRLRAVGRLEDAAAAMEVGLKMRLKQLRWKSAAIYASNLADLEMLRGYIDAAISRSKDALAFANKHQDPFHRMARSTVVADALSLAGQRNEARRFFAEAEDIQATISPDHPRLYSIWGSRYWDFMLADVERVAWRIINLREDFTAEQDICGFSAMEDTCNDVHERATIGLSWIRQFDENAHLKIALTKLMIGRALLLRTLFATLRSLGSISLDPVRSSPGSECARLDDFEAIAPCLDDAVRGFRHAQQTDHLPRGLLTRAWLHHLLANPTAATTDLDEAESIATRCGMPIFLADVHLTRARLFRDRTELGKARELLLDLRTKGYHRHDEMLADTEQAASTWPKPTP
jgi:tetratricopeptide (TPR) repeat protein